MLAYAFQDKMLKKDPDERIVLALLATNGTLSLLFILVAMYANHCLLARDDKRYRQLREDERISVGDSISQDGIIATSPSRLYDAAGILSSPPLSPIWDVSYTFPNEVVTAGSKDISPVLNSQSGVRDEIRGVYFFSPATTPSVWMTNTRNVNRERNSIPNREANVMNWSIFRDAKSLLFMLAVCCSLTHAITALTLTLADPGHLDSGTSRRNEDLITSVQALLFFIYFTVLCILLYRLGDISGRLSAKRFRIILWGSIATLFTTMGIALELVLTDIFPMALEYFSSIYQGILAICFLVTSIVLPRRIVGYGESVIPIASKIRRVTITTAVSLIVRLVILLPIVQNRLAVVGVFAPSIFFFFSIIPLAASLHLLHSPG
ncbi:putative GPI-anchored surface protein [Trypanosoma theileri]|uniref:Putative GPI-anchored surface protein n=1 Tax=Trypanosoma theileri TaxID=67003 RepID=A0A1X0NR28_9TRYP|nr:putative GPI-anchored surface protein [Trypanosoma theileri]ORC86998.1 putative GPI-anchored surface protein [Trypanosoma theileri]